MPSVTYNGQSFAIDGRRFWMLGATIDYARVPAESWSQRIAAVKHAGFNTIVASCPWCVHEPRQDRFTFDGDADLAHFVRLCGKQGLRVVLRIGPFVGDQFDGGGLPNWLTDLVNNQQSKIGHRKGDSRMADTEERHSPLREQNEPFFERVITYFRRLLGELEELQATRGPRGGGPLLMLQIEHAWLCSNPEQAASYLRELTRLVRECGINIPLINANDLWQDIPGTIDTWRGGDELLSHLRQLRAVQPDAPRLLSEFVMSDAVAWGDKPEGRGRASQADQSAQMLLSRLAQCLAAGAQPIVNPFIGGTNFGFLGGRMPGSPDRFSVTSTASGAAVDEGGTHHERYGPIKRLMTFANHFGHVFAELSPEYHPIVPEPSDAVKATDAKAGAAGKHGLTVVPLSGSQGTIVFLFNGSAKHTGSSGSNTATRGRTTLLLSDGIGMPVELGQQSVMWLALNVDLGGVARLDYTNICPFAIVNRSILVLFGPAKAQAHLSISGSPLDATVPSAEKPFAMQHKGLTVVILNEEQIDRTYLGDDAVYVGAAGLAPTGEPIPESPGKQPWMVTSDGSTRRVPTDELAETLAGRSAKRITLKDWQASSAEAYATGESPRFATLSGPCTLNSCGAPTGYGWYRIRWENKTARKRLCHLPDAAHRAHLYVNDGSTSKGPNLLEVIGTGPGGASGPLELSLPKGELTLVALVDNLGRFSGGNDLGERTGLFGHLLEVKPFRAGKPKQVTATPVDPFLLRGYIEQRAKGQLSASQQLEWTFTHTRKSPILVDVKNVQQSGTFILNDVPIGYYSGHTGATQRCFTIGQTINQSFKRGKNILRFAPDAHQAHPLREMADGTTLYECVEAMTDGASWAFARWQMPEERAFESATKTGAKRLRGTPAWWRCAFKLPRGSTTANLSPIWFETVGLSKGQVFVNGRNLGRYFMQTATGKSIGPQKRLALPAGWLRMKGDNELCIFDEHGFDPYRARLRMGK